MTQTASNHSKESGIPISLILCIRNQRLREDLLRLLSSIGVIAEVVDDLSNILKTPLDDRVLVLETGEDVVLLVQTIYEMYLVSGLTRPLCILPIVSRSLVRQNPSLALWSIGGHAAISALVLRDSPTFERDVEEWIRRFS